MKMKRANWILTLGVAAVSAAVSAQSARFPFVVSYGGATILRLSPECRTLWYEVSIDEAE